MLKFECGAQKMKNAWCYLAVLAALGGCSKTRAPDRIEVLHAQPVVDEYEVVEGDTVNSIAKHFNMDPAQLVAINKLEPPYRIKVGQKLKVDNAESDMIVVKQVFYS